MQIVRGKRYYEGRKFNTVMEMLRQTANENGEKAAYVFRRNPEGDVIEKTYNQYLHDVESFGTSLMGRGLEGKHIAILGENRYEWAVAHTAVVNGVGVSVPLDRLLPLNEVSDLLLRGEAKAYIFSPAYYSDALEISRSNKDIKLFICMMASELKEKMTDDPRFIDMGELIEEGRKKLSENDRSFTEAKINPEKMASLLFTSGTTAMSKGVMLSQKNICSNIYSVSGVLKVDSGSRTLSVLPLHHTFENTVGMYVMQYYGATICFTDGLRYISKNLLEWKINNILAVPLLYENVYRKVNEALDKKGKKKLVDKMVKVSRVSMKMGIDVRRKLFKQILAGFGGELKLAVSGAAAIDPEIAKAFTDWGLEFYQGYGLTETSPVLSVCNPFVNVIGSIGNPVSEVELAIDTDEKEPGAKGEILARGQNVMLGYYRDEKATREAITPEGWLRTGDVGYFDRKGCIHITGRIKSMIVLSNGKKCFPEETESYINSIPGVRESVVWGEKNQRGLVDVAAILSIDREKISENTGSVADSDIAIWLNDKINDINLKMPSYKGVKYFVITESEFEKTTTLKIKRPEVEKMVHEKLRESGRSIKDMHLKNIDKI